MTGLAQFLVVVAMLAAIAAVVLAGRDVWRPLREWFGQKWKAR